MTLPTDDAARKRIVIVTGLSGAGKVSILRALEDLGFDVDVSVNPHMNYSSDGGPVFDGLEPTLATFGRRRRLLEVPCTTGFAGVLQAGVMRIFDRGLKYRQNDMTIKDMDLSPQMKWQLQQICSIFRVPLEWAERRFDVTSPSGMRHAHGARAAAAVEVCHGRPGGDHGGGQRVGGAVGSCAGVQHTQVQPRNA